MASNSASFLAQRTHRRFNALTGDWVLVSPHRTQRPWQGRKEAEKSAPLSSYDPQCYLCPGNARANRKRNPRYESTFVFDNDFPALLQTSQPRAFDGHALLQAHLCGGVSRVICYSPRHDLTLAELPITQIRTVVDTWISQYEELIECWKWVQIFENKGEIMGCSNPHPHGQIWASDFMPSLATREFERQRDWFKALGSPLLLNYCALESEVAERVVIGNGLWVAVVPWWAVWPFETLLLPRRHVRHLGELNEAEKDALADILARLLSAYDELFGVPFPYSFGWHAAPKATDGECWQLHGHFFPPLLRSATVQKFMVGYEMLAEAQRDLTPEFAAQCLRSGVKNRSG